MNPIARRSLIVGTLCVAILAACRTGAFAQIALTGWQGFLTRTLPQYEIPWARLIGFVAGFAILMWGCRRVFRRPSTRSTLLAGAIGLSLCLAGAALTGIAHQLYWLNSGREDLRASRFDMEEPSGDMYRIPFDEARLRNELTRFGEDYSFVILRNDAGHHLATLLIPSDPGRPVFGVAQANRSPCDFSTHPRAELRSIIRAIEAGRPELLRK